MTSVAGRDISGWRRSWLLPTTVVVLAGVVVGCWKLTADLWEPGQSSADPVAVLSLLVGIVGVVLTAVPIWWTVKGPRPVDSGQAVRILVQAVRTQRQRFLDQALAVSWQIRPARLRFTDLAAEVLPRPVEALLLCWQDLSGAEAGSIEDVAAFYQNQPTGRLVVLGAPGAGKTVLLSRLVPDLLDQIDALPDSDLRAQVRVPVLLSLPACDLGDVYDASVDQLVHRLQAWITARLREDYGLRPAQASILMHDQLILPVLDGLDEMDPITAATGTGTAERPRAVAVLRALNAGIRMPVVLACRQTEYLDISQAATTPVVNPTILTDARHVTLRPLDKKEIIAYLTARFPGRDGQLCTRWHCVADALNKQTHLLGVLANPWQLFLVVTTYTDENRDLKELLKKSPEEVEAHLLANLIPAIVEHNDTATRHGWTAKDVTRWLGAIASHQHRAAVTRGTSETDIYLSELWRVADSSYPRWMTLVLGLTPVMGVILVSYYTDPPGWYLVLALIGLAVLGFIVRAPRSAMARIDLGGLRTPKGRRRLRTGLAIGLAVGLGFVLLFGLTAGLAGELTGGLPPELVLIPVFGLTVGLAAGLAFGLAGGLADEVAAVSSASVLAKQCLAYTVVVGLIVGLVFGLAGGQAGGLADEHASGRAAERVSGLAGGLAGGLVFGLAFGLVGGLVLGNGSVWLRYAIAVRAAARQKLLPTCPARFLDWCLHTGLMRMAGIAIQFRHRRLQEALHFQAQPREP
jgi:GTPase SAR1 family protein